VGVDADALPVEGASLAHWGPRDLHRLVAHFLRARFPLLLALNKADVGSAAGHIPRVLAAHPHEPAVAVSAASERWLCQQRRAGLLRYSDGAGNAQAVPPAGAAAAEGGAAGLAPPPVRSPPGPALPPARPAFVGPAAQAPGGATEQRPAAGKRCAPHPPTHTHPHPPTHKPTRTHAAGQLEEVAHRLQQLRDRVLLRYGSTGVALALAAAVALRPPRLAFPVSDLESCSSLVACGASSGAAGVVGSGQDAKVGVGRPPTSAAGEGARGEGGGG
jgi:hypothetical protein